MCIELSGSTQIPLLDVKLFPRGDISAISGIDIASNMQPYNLKHKVPTWGKFFVLVEKKTSTINCALPGPMIVLETGLHQ
jgi:hypothetical protein